MSAYSQAEKDVVARNSPELHYNRGIALKYEEEFQAALTSFSTASGSQLSFLGLRPKYPR